MWSQHVDCLQSLGKEGNHLTFPETTVLTLPTLEAEHEALILLHRAWVPCLRPQAEQHDPYSPGKFGGMLPFHRLLPTLTVVPRAAISFTLTSCAKPPPLALPTTSAA